MFVCDELCPELTGLLEAHTLCCGNQMLWPIGCCGAGRGMDALAQVALACRRQHVMEAQCQDYSWHKGTSQLPSAAGLLALPQRQPDARNGCACTGTVQQSRLTQTNVPLLDN